MTEQGRYQSPIIPGGLTGEAWERRVRFLQTGVCPGHVWEPWDNQESGVKGVGCTACCTVQEDDRD